MNPPVSVIWEWAYYHLQKEDRFFDSEDGGIIGRDNGEIYH